MAPSALKPPPSAPSTLAHALMARSNPSSTTTSTGDPRKSAPRTERRSCTQISVVRATTIRRTDLAQTSNLRPLGLHGMAKALVEIAAAGEADGHPRRRPAGVIWRRAAFPRGVWAPGGL